MRQIIIRLPAADFAELARRAEQEERPPDRQATWMLRQALAEPAPAVVAGAQPGEPARAGEEAGNVRHA